MGSAIGVFRESEVKHLSRSDRDKLKRHALRHLQSAKEIRAIMKKNPKAFTKDKDVNKLMRKKLGSVMKGMPKK